MFQTCREKSPLQDLLIKMPVGITLRVTEMNYKKMESDEIFQSAIVAISFDVDNSNIFSFREAGKFLCVLRVKGRTAFTAGRLGRLGQLNSFSFVIFHSVQVPLVSQTLRSVYPRVT